MSFVNSFFYLPFVCIGSLDSPFSFVLPFLYRDEAHPSVDSADGTTEGKHDVIANEDVEEKEKTDASAAVVVGDARRMKKPKKLSGANGNGTAAELDPLPVVLHGRVPPPIPYFANNDAEDTLDNYVQLPPVEQGKEKKTKSQLKVNRNGDPRYPKGYRYNFSDGEFRTCVVCF